MKATIYIALGLAVAGSVAWMYYQGSQTAPVVPVLNFAADDERIYQTLRADLQQYEFGRSGLYPAGLDDLAREKYNAGANINGMASKTAAFVEAASIHYPAKRRYYTTLLNNLKTRYSVNA